MRRCVLVLTALLGVTALGGCSSKNAAADAVPAAATASSAPPVATGAASAMATADVSRVGPALDGYFRTNGYPTTLEAVFESMPKANLVMDPADALGGYRLDATGKAFRLCVEHDSGAWATYDTSSMKVDDHGLTGGCTKF